MNSERQKIYILSFNLAINHMLAVEFFFVCSVERLGIHPAKGKN